MLMHHTHIPSLSGASSTQNIFPQNCFTKILFYFILFYFILFYFVYDILTQQVVRTLNISGPI